MSLYRYVNSSPSLSVLPSISPDHHPRTLLMAAKASSGVWSTVKELVKFLALMIISTFSRTRPRTDQTWDERPSHVGIAYMRFFLLVLAPPQPPNTWKQAAVPTRRPLETARAKDARSRRGARWHRRGHFGDLPFRGLRRGPEPPAKIHRERVREDVLLPGLNAVDDRQRHVTRRGLRERGLTGQLGINGARVEPEDRG